jgi:hypothetical protein
MPGPDPTPEGVGNPPGLHRYLLLTGVAIAGAVVGFLIAQALR